MNNKDTQYQILNLFEKFMAAEQGFEPRYWASKAHVLPLDDPAIKFSLFPITTDAIAFLGINQGREPLPDPFLLFPLKNPQQCKILAFPPIVAMHFMGLAKRTAMKFLF